MNERKKCKHDGCDNLGRNKGYYKGHIRYGKFCEKHHKRFSNHNVYWTGKALLDNRKCSKCGWDKAPCDRHRINPELGYTEDNVVILCPNCHREAHTNKSSVSQLNRWRCQTPCKIIQIILERYKTPYKISLETL